jgi:hypothetical protein
VSKVLTHTGGFRFSGFRFFLFLARLESGVILGTFEVYCMMTASLADVVFIVCRPLFVTGSENGSLAPFLDGEVPNSLVAEVGVSLAEAKPEQARFL